VKVIPKEPKEPKLPKIVIKIEKEKEHVWLGPNEKAILLRIIAVVGVPLAMDYLENLYKNYGKNKQDKDKNFFENIFNNFITSDSYGINKLKTKKEVKDRCNELYLIYHPDKQGGDSKKFIEIREICEKKMKTFK
jgi:hypothetical protein